MAQSTSRSNQLSTQPVAAGAPIADVISLADRARATDQAGSAVAGQLSGSLAALLLYIGEIKQHSDRLAESVDERAYLQAVVANALRQTEQVCALVKLLSDGCPPGKTGPVRGARPGQPEGPPPRKPLIPREREVLQLISEGLTNKQGALRMKVSPRTFESHRAETMRKLGARNTAELVRAALLNQLG